MSAQGKAWYAEQCRKPQWQKKRLEILERDGWECQECGNTDKTLVVHHRYYKRGAKPWDYPTGALVTLCEGCHEDLCHGAEDRLTAIILDTMFTCFSHDALIHFIGFLADVSRENLQDALAKLHDMTYSNLAQGDTAFDVDCGWMPSQKWLDEHRDIRDRVTNEAS